MNRKQQAAFVEEQLNLLVETIRKREGEGYFADCEQVVRATVLVVSGRSAVEAMLQCKIPTGGT